MEVISPVPVCGASPASKNTFPGLTLSTAWPLDAGQIDGGTKATDGYAVIRPGVWAADYARDSPDRSLDHGKSVRTFGLPDDLAGGDCGGRRGGERAGGREYTFESRL